jgi:hypothetical protein
VLFPNSDTVFKNKSTLPEDGSARPWWPPWNAVEEEISMSRKMLRVVLALALTLTTLGAAQASGFNSSRDEAAGLAAVWESVASWLRGVPALTALWEKDGSSMDPNGDSTSNADDGPAMDPNGR